MTMMISLMVSGIRGRAAGRPRGSSRDPLLSRRARPPTGEYDHHHDNGDYHQIFEGWERTSFSNPTKIPSSEIDNLKGWVDGSDKNEQ